MGLQIVQHTKEEAVLCQSAIVSSTVTAQAGSTLYDVQTRIAAKRADEQCPAAPSINYTQTAVDTLKDSYQGAIIGAVLGAVYGLPGALIGTVVGGQTIGTCFSDLKNWTTNLLK